MHQNTRYHAMKRAGQRASGGFNTAERPAETERPAERLAERPADCEGATSSMESDGDHLYLLQYPWDQSWDHSPIKVGRAQNVAARVRSLESGHNFRLRVLTIFPGQGKLERRVHALLSEHRAAGGRGHEWFTVTMQQALAAVALAIASCVHSRPPADPV